MKIIKIIVPFLLFIAGGMFGLFSQSFIQTNKSLFYLFIIPAFVFGVYYAFRLTPKYEKNKGGGVALGRIAITIFITALSYRATQGYVIFFNCYAGRQLEKQIIGEVSQINFPKPKQIFDKNSIVIILNDNQEKISLEVPTDDYYVGQIFTKKMFLGSFGILYSPK